MRATNLSIVLFCFICFIAVNLSTTIAQDKKSVKVTASEVDKSKSENPNIKSKAPATDDNPAPKPKGALCQIDFANYTGYYIDIYVNGYYIGTVSPWGTYPVDAYAGYTTIYCITTGGTFEWSRQGSCDYYFIYELYAM